MVSAEAEGSSKNLNTIHFKIVAKFMSHMFGIDIKYKYICIIPVAELGEYSSYKVFQHCIMVLLISRYLVTGIRRVSSALHKCLFPNKVFYGVFL